MKISDLFSESRKADSNEKRSIQKAFEKTEQNVTSICHAAKSRGVENEWSSPKLN
jgi:hypothetical protein